MDPGPSKRPSRGKPKVVYATPPVESTDTPSSSTLTPVIEDDEHVILRLKVGAAHAPGADDADAPDPAGYSTHNTFESKPFEIGNGAASEQPITPEPSHEHRHRDAALKVMHLLREFGEKSRQNEWPSSTSVCCHWCCHRFEGPPFGLPVKLVDDVFHVVGCFCSLECVVAHNYASNDGMDEVWERQNLCNLLAKKLELPTPVKPAPSRIVLKMFGGVLDIDEFRAYCQTGKVMCLNFPPMVAMTQQVEEAYESDITCDYKFIPLDNDRINRYKEKLKLRRAKPLVNPKNTLDHSMNLKIHS
jgi:hypothetical protein